MKDRLLYGLFPGLSAPFIIILLFWLFRFHDLPLSQFIHQAIALKVQFKLISVGVFFADLGLFYLFLHLNKNNASKGVILAVLSISFFFYFPVFRSERRFPSYLPSSTSSNSASSISESPPIFTIFSFSSLVLQRFLHFYSPRSYGSHPSIASPSFSSARFSIRDT